MPDFKQFNVEDDNGVAILQLTHSRLHDHEAIKQLGDELKELTADVDSQSLLFNMDGVDFISSAVLNKLIVLDKQLKSAGGKMGFCSLHPQVAEVFSITRLNQIFPIFADKQQGVTELGGGE